MCTSLWDGLDAFAEPVRAITTDHIDRLAQVDRALARFYGDVVRRVGEAAGIDEFDLRGWCEQQLITAGGTRALVYRDATATAGMANAVVDHLEAEHLIRAEERAGARWYELSHDKFVEAIQTGNRSAFEQQVALTSQFGARAEEWNAEITGSVAALASFDEEDRRAAVARLMAALASGPPPSGELRDRLMTALSQTAADPLAPTDVRRNAANLGVLLDSPPPDNAQYARATAKYVRYARIRVRRIILPAVALAAGLSGSLLALAALSSQIVGRWPLTQFGWSEWAALGVLAAVWTALYIRETLENFPIDSFRRSDRQGIQTLTAPIAPYYTWTDAYELVAGWPANLVVPWAAAAGAGALANSLLGWSYTLVFVAILIVGTGLDLAAYVEVQVLLHECGDSLVRLVAQNHPGLRARREINTRKARSGRQAHQLVHHGQKTASS